MPLTCPRLPHKVQSSLASPVLYSACALHCVSHVDSLITLYTKWAQIICSYRLTIWRTRTKRPNSNPSIFMHIIVISTNYKCNLLQLQCTLKSKSWHCLCICSKGEDEWVNINSTSLPGMDLKLVWIIQQWTSEAPTNWFGGASKGVEGSTYEVK